MKKKSKNIEKKRKKIKEKKEKKERKKKKKEKKRRKRRKKRKKEKKRKKKIKKKKKKKKIIFFFKQKTAYEIKECDWSSDVCSSDLCDRIRKESKWQRTST